MDKIKNGCGGKQQLNEIFIRRITNWTKPSIFYWHWTKKFVRRNLYWTNSYLDEKTLARKCLAEEPVGQKKTGAVDHSRSFERQEMALDEMSTTECPMVEIFNKMLFWYEKSTRQSSTTLRFNFLHLLYWKSLRLHVLCGFHIEDFTQEFLTRSLRPIWMCSRWIFSFQGSNSFHRIP